MREAIVYASEITNLINEINIEDSPASMTEKPQKAVKEKASKEKAASPKDTASREDSMDLPDLDLTVNASLQKEQPKKAVTPQKQVVIKTEKQQPIMLPPASILPTASFMQPPLHTSSMFQPPHITSTIIAQSLMPPSIATHTQTRQSRSTASKKTPINNLSQTAATKAANKTAAKKAIPPTPFNYNTNNTNTMGDASFMSQMSQSQSKKRNSSRRNNKGETQLHLAVMNVK